MRRSGWFLIWLTALWAQPPATYDTWLNGLQNQNLAGLQRLLAQPQAPAWPELANVPSPLATLVFQRIKELESAPPEVNSIPARVEMYAELIRSFRNAHGYANYVLADTLQVLSILHIGRLVLMDGRRASECSKLLRSLDLPMLSPRAFREIYQAKLGSGARLNSLTQEALTPGASTQEAMIEIGRAHV